MGEILSKIASICIKGVDYEIELNKPVFGTSSASYHIQSESIRLELSKSQYLSLAVAICKAQAELNEYK